MDSLTIFILGGYSGTVGFGLSDNFHFGGGGILGQADLDSLTIFILGGYSGTVGFGLSDNFHWGGGVFCTKLLQNRGILWDLDQNFNHSSRLKHHR